jgi:hypothetical protein
MPMFYWIYDLHPLAAVGAFAVSLVAVCWVAIILSRPIVQSRFHRQPGLNELVGDFLQYFGVIYGLLLGLLAVATYQNLSDVDKTVGNEAPSLAALYRDVSGYPEPKRSELEGLLRDYTRYHRRSMAAAAERDRAAWSGEEDRRLSGTPRQFRTRNQIAGIAARYGHEAIQHVL